MLITWLSANVLPHLLKALAFGKKQSVKTFRTFVIGILSIMLWNQQTMQSNLNSTMKNTDTLKTQLAAHLKDYDDFKKEVHTNMIAVNEDIKDIDAKTERNKETIQATKDNYTDQLLRLFRKKWNE